MGGNIPGASDGALASFSTRWAVAGATQPSEGSYDGGDLHIGGIDGATLQPIDTAVMAMLVSGVQLRLYKDAGEVGFDAADSDWAIVEVNSVTYPAPDSHDVAHPCIYLDVSKIDYAGDAPEFTMYNGRPIRIDVLG